MTGRQGSTRVHGVVSAFGSAPAEGTGAAEEARLLDLEAVARDNGWALGSTPETLGRALAAMQAGESLAVFDAVGSADALGELPPDWRRVESLPALKAWCGPKIAVTDRVLAADVEARGGPLLIYHPRTLVIGVGCVRGASGEEIESLARSAVADAGLAWQSVGTVATIDRRRTEPGIVELVAGSGLGLATFTADALAAVAGVPTPSPDVRRHIGTPGVCEPAAILASGGGRLIVPKRKSAHVTVAVARIPSDRVRSAMADGGGRGRRGGGAAQPAGHPQLPIIRGGAVTLRGDLDQDEPR